MGQEKNKACQHPDLRCCGCGADISRDTLSLDIWDASVREGILRGDDWVALDPNFTMPVKSNTKP